MTEPSPDDRPDVLHVELPREQVDALFADLQQAANIHRVMVRQVSAASRPIDTAMTLQQAHQLLDDDRTRAVQIQYDFDGATWCDTLMLGPNGIRLVRTTLPEGRE